MAAYVYSMADSFYLYESFNDAVSQYRDGKSSYPDFHYKGLYALLLLLSQQYSSDLYRGIDSDVDAQNNTFIRFDRFSSASTDMTAATNFATDHGQGTLLLFKGIKRAAHIAPFSKFPDEDEYLLDPESQFRVVDVSDFLPDGRKGRQILLVEINYN